MGAPLILTEDMIKTLNIKYVVAGTTKDSTNFRENGFTLDVKLRGLKNSDSKTALKI